MVWHFYTELVEFPNGTKSRWRWTCIDVDTSRESAEAFQTYSDCIKDALACGMTADSANEVHAGRPSWRIDPLDP
jgi:hypothetical protein